MTNTVQLPGTDMTSSVIGFGCASLGSRISKQQGLAALNAAFDKGVTWYDVAPAYGAGEAEPIIGEFLRGRRDKVLICSKVGVVPPARNDLLKLVYMLARPALTVASGLRRKFRKMSATRNQTLPLTPDFIRGSIERSLKRLGTDHLDVFALHKPSIEDMRRDDVQRTLEDILKSGKARYISVAGAVDAARAAIQHPEIYRLVQLADNPTSSPLPQLTTQAGRPLAFITHSVLGVDGAMDRLLQSLSEHPEDLKKIRAAGYGGSEKEAVAALLVDRALASNRQGVVLASMFSQKHQASNIARAARPVNPDAIRLVDELVKGKIRVESVA
ncbi:MAG TPA: aldo/keto reductase [Pararhizobium sp.]|uniref:aldo/keto reductase n=1 Tax=Pararhizobium sp. TaxID=1977563 RepID=UPI002C39A62F|nr:aldo/keto reductase [Pararhizobium sp.]HTO29943.1 aldo/keto reductase [Pararhizobium sp.]